jgi:hypothetical protein
MRGQADTHAIRRRIDDRVQHGGQGVGLEVLAARAEQRDVADMGLMRRGAMPELFGGVRAPSALGSFLCSFTWARVAG